MKALNITVQAAGDDVEKVGEAIVESVFNQALKQGGSGGCVNLMSVIFLTSAAAVSAAVGRDELRAIFDQIIGSDSDNTPMRMN